MQDLHMEENVYRSYFCPFLNCKPLIGKRTFYKSLTNHACKDAENGFMLPS
jgi:hypothetical protein